jgi:HEAT repeat protein
MTPAVTLAVLSSLLLPGIGLAAAAVGRQLIHARRRRAVVRELWRSASQAGRTARSNPWLRLTEFLGEAAEENEGLEWVLESLAEIDVARLRPRVQASFEQLVRDRSGRRWRRMITGHLLLLRETPHNDLLAPLAACLLHADPLVAGTAALVIGHRPEPYAGAALGLAAALREAPSQALRAQVWCLKRLLDAHLSLVELLEEDPAPAVRRVVARAAGGHLAREEDAARAAELAALVERRAHDRDLTVRQAAFESARQLSKERQIALCSPALVDADAQIRRLAAAALAVGGEAGVTLLVRALRECEPSTRQEILALFEDRPAGVPVAVREQAESGETESRRWAIEAIGALGDASEIPMLVSLLGSRDRSLRAAAAHALAALGRKGAAQTALREAIERMLPAWHREEDPEVIVALADALAQTGDPAAGTALLARLGSVQAGVRERLLEELARCEQLAAREAAPA